MGDGKGSEESRCSGPGVLPDPGIEPVSSAFPALQADSLPLSHWGSSFSELLDAFTIL